LTFDFGTTGNRDSLQGNIPTPPSLAFENPLQITDAFGLLAYLLGYRVRYRKPSKSGFDWSPEEGVCGNLNDASFVNWVLSQNGCPKYVVKPQGAYEEAGYLELIRFLIEQNGLLPYLHIPGHEPCPDVSWAGDSSLPENWYPYGDVLFQLRGDCLKEYYCCHGGIDCYPCQDRTVPTAGVERARAHRKDESKHKEEHKDEASQPSAVQNVYLSNDPNQIAQTVGLRLSRAEFIAIAGELCGTKRLLTGNTLRVISPSMRSSRSWDTRSLVDRLDPSGIMLPEEKAFVLSMIATLSESALNDGVAPEERAFNFASTAILGTLAALLTPGTPFHFAVTDFDPPTSSTRRLFVGFDGLTVEPAKCKDVDTLPYDVSLIFFNTHSLRPTRVFVTATVNVADVNPVAQVSRVSIRR
jgi:hypothetical protein